MRKMPSHGGRRSSSSSSDSRSLSPYNKRRRGRSPDKGRKSPQGRRTHSHRSRSPRRRSYSPRRRSGSPRRRSSPQRRYLPPPQRRRSSPQRSHGNRPPPRRSPPRRSPPRRRSSTPPRSRKRSLSPRRRTPSPKRRRTPEHRGPPPRHRSPSSPAPTRNRRSPPRRDPNRPYQSHHSRSRSPPPSSQRRNMLDPPPNKPASDRPHVLPRTTHQRSQELPYATSEPSVQRSHDRSPPRSNQSQKVSGQSAHRSRDYPLQSPPRGTDKRGRSPPRQRPPSMEKGRGRSRDRKVDKVQIASSLGSKDMDYRDKRMGDPRAAAARNSEKSPFGEQSEPYYTNGGPHRLKKELGCTGMSTNTRFRAVDDTPDPTPKDLITIGIERNILGDEPAVISPVYKPEDVVIPRRRDEGDKPLHSREEFMTREEEYIERRVIKMVKSDDTHERFELNDHENFQVRRDKMSLNDRWKEDPKIEQQVMIRRESLKGPFPSSSRNVERRTADNSDPLRHGDRDERLVQPRRREDRNYSPIGDRDERIVSDTRSDFRKDEDLRVKGMKDRTRYEKDPNDLRHNLARRRRKDTGGDSSVTDARQKLEKKRDLDKRRPDGEKGPRFERRVEPRSPNKDSLPDFSRRPDKGKYQEWENNPEMIPKGTSYFEVSSVNHENTSQGQCKPQSVIVIQSSNVNSSTKTQSIKKDTSPQYSRSRPQSSRSGSRYSRSRSNSRTRVINSWNEQKEKIRYQSSYEPPRSDVKHQQWEYDRAESPIYEDNKANSSNELRRISTKDQDSRWIASHHDRSIKSNSPKDSRWIASHHDRSDRSNSPKDSRWIASHHDRSDRSNSPKDSRWITSHHGRSDGSNAPKDSRWITSHHGRSDNSTSPKESRWITSHHGRSNRSDSPNDSTNQRYRRDKTPLEERRQFQRLSRDNRERSISPHDVDLRIDRNNTILPVRRVKNYSNEVLSITKTKTENLGQKKWSPILSPEDQADKSRAPKRGDLDLRSYTRSDDHWKEDNDKNSQSWKSKHDNRDDVDYWEKRGRGRGWRGSFRGRGVGSFRGRGGSRGRGSLPGAGFGVARRTLEPEWVHDKYDDEELPSSTTK